MVCVQVDGRIFKPCYSLVHWLIQHICIYVHTYGTAPTDTYVLTESPGSLTPVSLAHLAFSIGFPLLHGSAVRKHIQHPV